MPHLPEVERILLGPGPSPVSPRVMRAMAAPVLSHLDPQMLALMDDVRARLQRVFQAPDDYFSLAVSGTGSAGMEAAVANLVREGTTVVVVVTGYFGERLVQMCERYGAVVHRVDSEWGRAADPDDLRRVLKQGGTEVVAMVHAETSTGVLNPVDTLCAIAREHGCRTIVDTVTSLGGHPVDVAGWQADAVYSCSQKGLGAPSGLAPVTFAPHVLDRGACRSFYLDARLLHEFWVGRKYHHTISAPLVYALREALHAVEDEGLEARWARHRRHHRVLASGLGAMGLELLPPEAERLWTLNAVCVPDGVREPDVRRFLLERFNLEVGAGLGPLAGRIWRVGLMGTGSSSQLILLFLSALERALREQDYSVQPGLGTAAAGDALSTIR
ncbi:MAG: alanine--glyoxylate aminotransferase family protein [Acidobacteria bacterium]|nr:alanine--glyoxylate aminotransferase family protein [Acidobacteriota bacterium]